MNGQAQATHTRKTDALAQVIADTQGAVVERFEDVEASFAAMHDKVEIEDRKLASRMDTDLGIVVRLSEITHAFLGRGFWSRLNWLLTGR